MISPNWKRHSLILMSVRHPLVEGMSAIHLIRMFHMNFSNFSCDIVAVAAVPYSILFLKDME